jgi:hypothetical protein
VAKREKNSTSSYVESQIDDFVSAQSPLGLAILTLDLALRTLVAMKKKAAQRSSYLVSSHRVIHHTSRLQQYHINQSEVVSILANDRPTGSHYICW